MLKQFACVALVSSGLSPLEIFVILLSYSLFVLRLILVLIDDPGVHGPVEMETTVYGCRDFVPIKQ